MKLTPSETAVMKHTFSEYQEGEEQGFVTSAEIAEALGVTPRGAGSVLGHLCRKELMSFGNEKPNDKSTFTFRLTIEGLKVASQIGDEPSELVKQNVDKAVIIANKAIKAQEKLDAAHKRSNATIAKAVKSGAVTAKIWIADFKEKDVQVEFSAGQLEVGVPTSKGVAVMSYDTLKSAKADLRKRGAVIRAKK